MINVVADENIPGLEPMLAGVGHLRRLPGRSIRSGDLRGADALLVRSVTQVDAALLRHSPVRFVGSCTTGIDHVDVSALSAAGIRFAHAPGANARSVVEYVFSALSWLVLRRRLKLPHCSVGIVGLGQVGGRLYRMLSAAGLQCVGYDPFIEPRLGVSQVDSLERALRADIVTLHTPLTRAGSHPTWHLLDAARLRLLRPGAVLINSSRGAVVDNAALAALLAAGVELQVVLDVWENEPLVDRALLRDVALATPHIAGYSYDGKRAGVEMVVQQLFASLGIERGRPGADGEHSEILPEFADVSSDALAEGLSPDWQGLCRQMLAIYDIGRDDGTLRSALADATEPGAAFEALRRNYPRRRESSHYRLPGGARNRIDFLQDERRAGEG